MPDRDTAPGGRLPRTVAPWHGVPRPDEALDAARADWYADLVTGADPGDCARCAPFACDDPDGHLGVPAEYAPRAARGCRCGADADGRDCMCFE